MDTAIRQNGWQRLPNGFDVEFRHSIPVRLSDNGMATTVSDDYLQQAVTALGRMQVRLGTWQPGEKTGEREARIFADSREFFEVLKRLALSAAALFVDRYHKPIDNSDTDWDRLEYLKDYLVALAHCGLDWGDVNPDLGRDLYIRTMHEESRRLARLAEPPLTAPE